VPIEEEEEEEEEEEKEEEGGGGGGGGDKPTTHLSYGFFCLSYQYNILFFCISDIPCDS